MKRTRQCWAGHRPILEPCGHASPGQCTAASSAQEAATADNPSEKIAARGALSHVAQNSAAQPARVPEEPLLDPIERLSALIAARDQELRRLREELAARDLYIDQLHAVLRHQAERLERIEQRVRNLVPRPEP